MKVDLVWLAESNPVPDWSFGAVWVAAPAPAAVAACVERNLPASTSDAWLFWDSALGLPEPERITQALERPGDVWHAGLRLGLAGQPGILDFIHPTWMLTCDPDANIEATSWRLSLRCCLVKTAVLRQMGGPRPEFDSLDAASLELGYCFVRYGVFVRHLPGLLPGDISPQDRQLSFADEYRILALHHARRWQFWALFRSLWSGFTSLKKLFDAQRTVRAIKPATRKPYQHHPEQHILEVTPARVTVLIPTVNRYPYLRVLLDQLRQQIVPPHEIILIDQTPIGERDLNLSSDFADLALQVFTLDPPGQCSARNLGLQNATGDYILFIDDDDEIEPDLIQKHLANLAKYRCDVSSGVADDPTAGPLPENFTYLRASDVFPTNNTLVRKCVLERSGLFDLAYDRGKRADGDLGMRIYLSGALMVLDPSISVFHHHAPVGGLRTHGARKITYASSRRSLTQRHLITSYEIYLAQRYFKPRQVYEIYWLNILGTYGLKGSGWRKLFKFFSSTLMLADSLLQTARNRQAASRLMKQYPQIPGLM